MKKNYFLLVLTALLLGSFGLANAQVRYVDVDPGIGTLNEAINSDTTATGERVDPENTIYRLQRGDQAYYGLTGSISNSGYPLHIAAAEGDGARPFLQPRVVDSESSRPFRPRGSITLKGLHVTGKDDLGGLTTRMLRCDDEGIRVVLEDCWFDQDGQSWIRVDDPNMTFIVRNCVISNIGQPKDANNGRGIDDRGNDIDTLIIENSTFFNVTSRVLRDDGGKIKYARVNNNTFANIGQMALSFGPIDTLVMQNNLMVNGGFIPMDDENGWIVLSADSVDGVAPVVFMNNNSAIMDTAAVSMYYNDTTMAAAFISPTLGMAIEANPDNDPNFNLDVSFTDGPVIPDSIMIYMFDDELDIDNTPEWEVPELPEDGNGLYHLDVYYDFGYVHSMAKVAGMDGGQLGDPQWTTDWADFMMIDFEGEDDRPFWNLFANDGNDPDDLMIVENPDKSGANTSDQVMMFTVKAGADAGAGAWSDGYGYMSFTQEVHHMEMMVWKNKLSDIGLMVENGGTANEVKVANTLTGEWEVVQFDFTGNIGESLTRLSLFPDYGERTEDAIVYIDDIKIITSPVSARDMESEELALYPNPVSNILNVEAEGIMSVTVLDILGKQVRYTGFQGVDQATLDLGELTPGVYFIRVDTRTESLSRKILKQ